MSLMNAFLTNLGLNSSSADGAPLSNAEKVADYLQRGHVISVSYPNSRAITHNLAQKYLPKAERCYFLPIGGRDVNKFMDKLKLASIVVPARDVLTAVYTLQALHTGS